MRAMVLKTPGASLEQVERDAPSPAAGEVLVKVSACGVCRTDLHIIDGELPNPVFPIVPGHEIIGTIVKLGNGVDSLKVGERIGIPWLGKTCGHCSYCNSEKENLCDSPSFTGYQIDGGYAEFTVADAQYCFPIQGSYSDAEAAPLLCAGLIGYRSFCMIGDDAQKIGIYGFGAAAHIVTQIALYRGCAVYAFTRPGDTTAQDFALGLGAVWSGSSNSSSPVELDAAIIFAPVGPLIPAALRAVRKGGVVVCGGIHMSEIPAFPYEILWGERILRSVTNLTRQDAKEFLKLAPEIPIRTSIQTFSLGEANYAITALRRGNISGAAVLIP